MDVWAEHGQDLTYIFKRFGHMMSAVCFKITWEEDRGVWLKRVTMR